MPHCQKGKMEQHLAPQQVDLQYILVFLKYQGKQLPRYYLLETKIKKMINLKNNFIDHPHIPLHYP